MKAIHLLFLMIGTTALSQNVLVKKDGSKIPMFSYNVNAKKQQVEYKVNSQENSVKFVDVDSVVIDKKVLKPFSIGKKQQLLNVVSTSNGKTLAVSSRIRKRERGGFESAVKHYEIYVFDKNELKETLKFTASKTESETNKRNKFFKIISDNFLDCNTLMERLQMFRALPDTDNLILLNYLDNPERIHCK